MPTQALERKTVDRPGIAQARPQRRRSLIRGLGLLLVYAIPALATGGLLWLSYFPVAWGWLGWVALAPLLLLVRSSAPGRRVFLAAWLGGLAFFWPALQWMRVADPQMYYTWAALATYCSLYVPVGVLLIRLLDRRTELPLVFSAPVVWTALEFLRSHLAEGFPWYLLSHTQHNSLGVIQISDLTGAYGVTFLLVAVNALIADVVWRLLGATRARSASEGTESTERRSPRWRFGLVGCAAQAAFVALLVIATLLYGDYRLRQEPFSKGPRVALVQCDVEQNIRNAGEAGSESEKALATDTMRDQYRGLQELAAGQNADLIVWPETSHVQSWVEASEDFPPHERARALAHTNRETLGEAVLCRTSVLFGFSAFVIEPSRRERRYNSAVLVDSTGRYVDRYDKMHRVPFGEYIPFLDWFPWMKVFSPYGGTDYSIRPGERFTRLPVGDYQFGVVICFEDSDSALARQYAGGDGQPSVDFLLNISNDAWFKGTSEHEEHLAISRFRAIECRRSVARAVNMGISAIIDGNGRVLAPEKIAEDDKGTVWEVRPDTGQLNELPVSRWSEFKKVKGIITGAIPIDHRTSWYARWGDWLPWTCWLGIAGFLVYGWVRPMGRTGTGSP